MTIAVDLGRKATKPTNQPERIVKKLILIKVSRFQQKHEKLPSMQRVNKPIHTVQGSHRLEKCLNLEGFLEKSLKIKSVLKSTGRSLKSLEKSLNSTIFCRT